VGYDAKDFETEEAIGRHLKLILSITINKLNTHYPVEENTRPKNNERTHIHNNDKSLIRIILFLVNVQEIVFMDCQRNPKRRAAQDRHPGSYRTEKRTQSENSDR